MTTVQDVLTFWIDEVGPERWYAADAALDAEITVRFSDLWEKARQSQLNTWASSPKGCLAYLIVTDQFPRNMFRTDPRAFATDAMARHVAARACHLGFDCQIDEPARQFFYLPLMHSESQMDQDRSVRMFLLRMPKTGAGNLLHARAHRAVIRAFGRFPYRNAALGRRSTTAEAEWLTTGGYSQTLRTLEAA